MKKPRSHEKIPLATQKKGSKFTTSGRNAGRVSTLIAQDNRLRAVLDEIFDELMPYVKKMRAS